MLWERKRILITVKAYPNPSKKYTETVCVAGIDIDNYKWVRLYPLPYRDLDNDKKFKKYSIIEVNACKANDDHRPESFKMDPNSIKILQWLDTKDKWDKRKKIVLHNAEQSFCQIQKEQETEYQSLGIFKPTHIDFIYKTARSDDGEERKTCYAQLSLFNKSKNEIEFIPFEFRYSLSCLNEPQCPGHNLKLIDWEIGQAYRIWREKYDSNLLLEKIKERWLDQICSNKRGVYFFVGNMQRFRNNFLILGVFYPPKV